MKRFISCILCLFFLLCFTSCSETENLSQKEKIIAVEYASADHIAGEDFNSDGFTMVTYNSSSDVVLAVENGKADYGILDDFELNSYISAGRQIKKKALCGYSVDYCMYFDSENEALQEAVNTAIYDLKKDGTLDNIKNNALKGVAYQGVESRKAEEKLVMLCDPSFPERIYMDGENVVGLDVDIAKEICNNLGYELEIVTADFDDLFTMLQDGEGDFIVSATQITENREEDYLLSDTYLTLNYYLIEKA